MKRFIYMNSNKTRLIIWPLLLLLTISLCGCTVQSSGGESSDINSSADRVLPELKEPVSASDFRLNTFVTITLYDRGDEALIQECFDLCQEYEELLSRTINTSEISRINSADTWPVTISQDTADLLSRALYYSELSEGAFDLTVAPLTSLWDFSGLNPVKPADADITEAVSHVNYENVILEGREVTLSDPYTAIDLGAIAKGYIADRMKDFLLSRGVQSAVINLGGNVLCVGSKITGNSRSEAFKIGIQKPFEDRNETIAAMEIIDMSVVSSGIYERCFTEDGVLYHHILNPDTGYPYDNSLISVTIISRKSVDGDALSTTCFALGPEKGMELINSLPETHAIFITDDYELHYSENFGNDITILE